MEHCSSSLEVIKLEYSLKLRIKRNDRLLVASFRKQPIVALYFEFENELKFITSGPGPQYISFCIVCIVLNYILSVSFEMWDNKKEKKEQQKSRKS